MGRDHEDLVLVTGRLASGVAFSCNVDWISPTKIRRTRVLGERGMFEADTLTADLTLFRNGDHVTAPWLQQQRGVTEGDMTRFAIAKPEPLGSELQALLAMVRGEENHVVTLEDGLETVRVAEAVLESARSGETVRL
jgi:predicted dehydrogenase